MLFFPALTQTSLSNRHEHYQLQRPSCSLLYDFFLWSFWVLFQYPVTCRLASLLLLSELICAFIVLYIFLPIFRPECSSFFLMPYYVLFMWLSSQFLKKLWLVRLKQLVVPILLYSVLSNSFCFDLLLKFFSCSVIPFYTNFVFWLYSSLPFFNETYIFAKYICFWLNSSFPEWFFFLLVFYFFSFLIIG